MSGRLPWVAGALALLAAGIVVLRPSESGRKAGGADRPAHASMERDGSNPSTERPGAGPERIAPTSHPAKPHSSASDPRANGDEPLPRELEDLVAGLDEPDGVRVSAAAAALIERGDTRAIALLAKIDLRAAAGGGASIVHALGRLGAIAGHDERATALERLLAMMGEEKRRGAPESAGNLLEIYEALGDIGDPRAAGPLEDELLDGAVARAAKVVITQALARIGQHRSRAPLLRARDRETAVATMDPLEEEIRGELVGAIDAALDRL